MLWAWHTWVLAPASLPAPESDSEVTWNILSMFSSSDDGVGLKSRRQGCLNAAVTISV